MLEKFSRALSQRSIPVLDTTWAVSLGLLSMMMMPAWASNNGSSYALEGLYMLWGLSYFVPLAIRRTHTDLAFCLTLIPHVIQLFVLPQPVVGNIVVPIMVYTVAVHSPRKLWLLVAELSAVLGGIRFMDTLNATHWDDEGNRTRIPPSDFSLSQHFNSFLVGFVMCALVVTSAWILGRLVVNVKEARQAEQDKQLALGRERDQFQLLAAEQERSAIARDMHDIVAHSLAVIVVQSDGAKYLVEQHPELDPQVAAAIATVGDTARDALRETRRLVGVLRATGDDVELAPSMSLAQLPELVETMSRAGLQVSYQQAGDENAHAPLPLSAQTALYRVAQEGLTNVVKHAGPHARCLVRLRHIPEGVELSIVDDGAGPNGTIRISHNDGHGHGIIGMRERMAAFGGKLIARDRLEGGFEVLAFLPAPRPGEGSEPNKPNRLIG